MLKQKEEAKGVQGKHEVYQMKGFFAISIDVNGVTTLMCTEASVILVILPCCKNGS